jgi:hypothetical protein
MGQSISELLRLVKFGSAGVLCFCRETEGLLRSLGLGMRVCVLLLVTVFHETWCGRYAIYGNPAAGFGRVRKIAKMI